MNKVFLIGNLTRDPELTETASGVAVCHFAIAVNRNYAGQDGERQTDFFNCTAWRGQAETIARFCKKGNKVAVTGSIQLRNYEDNQGVKRTAVDIIVQDVEFLTPKAGEDDMDMPRAAAPKKKPVLQAMEDDSDIPF
ncbi:MAG: single-stranded DNA-binding protein [Clostridia bacterium]|nr:single-stranded DNA-binding protein [Clostridia bacterium]